MQVYFNMWSAQHGVRLIWCLLTTGFIVFILNSFLFFQALQKEVNNRLGCGDAGGEDLKKHIFFRNINWPQLEAGMFKPPFVPDVSFSFITILMKGPLVP